MKALLLGVLLAVPIYGWSQAFPGKGQHPATAFPLCGKDTIRQQQVPLGFITTIDVPGCDLYPDMNPFYYTFTCYKTGTLEFVITPNDSTDDYDWMLFDITGYLPSVIYSNSNFIVNGDRSAVPGPTGAKVGGITSAKCSSAVSPFTKELDLVQGHVYILLVSHPSPTQSGYTLTFGGTAELNDPEPPRLLSVKPTCDRTILTVGITKFVRCNSLATDGSDFVLVNSSGMITNALGLNCSPQFDFDYLELSLASPLAPGNYTLMIRNGSDGNTLLNDCGVPAPDGNMMDFSVSSVLPVIDSIVPPVCQPSTIRLIFSSPVKCSSIAADGSDFIITGISAPVISGAVSNCSGNLTNEIDLALNAPIVADGSYQVSIKKGSDGNTITNECDSAAPEGLPVSFTVAGAVTADFDYQVGYGCRSDTVSLHYIPATGVNSWSWYTDSWWKSSMPDTVIYINTGGSFEIGHIASNGSCSDTVSKIINLDNLVRASFEGPHEVCPKSAARFINSSTGKISSYLWEFGDGSSSTDAAPADHLFPEARDIVNYPVSLVVQNEMGCRDTASQIIVKLANCIVTVPNAFTPNGDGRNDWLYPLNAVNLRNFEFRVYNRLGQLVFETRDISNKWDGTIHGHEQPTGTYVWFLSYSDESGRKVSSRGTTVLIR